MIPEPSTEPSRRAAEIADSVLAPNADAVDRAGRVAPQCVAALHASGLLELVPERAPDGGVDLVEACRVLEELGRGCVSTALLLTMHAVSCLYLGPWRRPSEEHDEPARTEAICRRVFDDVRSSGAIVANCYGEPGSGANLGLPHSRAARDGDGWLLDGVKFASFGEDASWYQLHARLHGEPGFHIVQFMVPRDTPGLRIERLPPTVGVRAAGPRRLILDGCRVPESLRFGAVDAFLTDNGRFPYAGLLLAAPYVGVARSALSLATSHLSARAIQGLGHTAARLPHVPGLVGSIFVELQQARSALYEAARAAVPDPGPEVRLASEAAKAAVGGMVPRVCQRALEACGTRMLLESFAMGRLLRDSLAAPLHPPTTAEAIDFVGRMLLGLPVAPLGPLSADALGGTELPRDDLPRPA